MNWKLLRRFPWLDSRAYFVSGLPLNGTLLDIGSSDGETLGHFAELRPDLKLLSSDIEGMPECYPPGTEFHRADITRDKLPWPDSSIDGVTCLQLVEHLSTLEPLLAEAARLLKPGGRIFFETPHPKTVTLDSPTGPLCGEFTLNFYDDGSHALHPVSAGRLASGCRAQKLSVIRHGISRNWLFALSWPFFFFGSKSDRKRWTAKVHWLGWSIYVLAQRSP